MASTRAPPRPCVANSSVAARRIDARVRSASREAGFGLRNRGGSRRVGERAGAAARGIRHGNQTVNCRARTMIGNPLWRHSLSASQSLVRQGAALPGLAFGGAPLGNLFAPLPDADAFELV